VRAVRRVVTGALELERAGKRIGSSLEAAPVVHVSDPDLFAAVVDIDLAEVAITSHATLVGEGPPSAFRLDNVKGVAVEVVRRRRPQMRPLVENPPHGRLRSGLPRRLSPRRAGAA
jgi:hypothetical protein